MATPKKSRLKYIIDKGIGGNSITNRGISELVKGKFPALDHLALNKNLIDAKGFRILANAPLNISSLSTNSINIDCEGIRFMTTADFPLTIFLISIWNNYR